MRELGALRGVLVRLLALLRHGGPALMPVAGAVALALRAGAVSAHRIADALRGDAGALGASRRAEREMRDRLAEAEDFAGSSGLLSPLSDEGRETSQATADPSPNFRIDTGSGSARKVDTTPPTGGAALGAIVEVLVYPCREAGRWGARARGRGRGGSTRTVTITAWDREEALRSAVARWYAGEDAVR
ncbi:MAG: hypothetical protein VYE22_40995 [Myxococcota bacterium]|nr:hypothetical protein [Myxococcota bacterium]